MNICNTDDKYALWCIIAHQFPKYKDNQTKRRMANTDAYKEHEHDIITKDIQYPVHLRDISRLERWNNLAVNVFSIDTKANTIPIRILDEKGT